MVTLGQITKHHVGEARIVALLATLLRMLHAASIPMTIVLPEPVAILQAWRMNSPPSSRGTSMP